MKLRTEETIKDINGVTIMFKECTNERCTKIIATLGPATDSEEMLEKLIIAGVNVFRLNMSHAKHDWVEDTVTKIRSLDEKLDKRVAILMDTQGPAIRTGETSTPLQLEPGEIIALTVRGESSEEEKSVDVNYDDLVNDISVGDTVVVDNGNMLLKVLEKKTNQFHMLLESLQPSSAQTAAVDIYSSSHQTK